MAELSLRFFSSTVHRFLLMDYRGGQDHLPPELFAAFGTEAGFVGYMQEHAAILAKIGIFFPFLVSAILKSAQGSSTVALTTTAGIMGAITDNGSMMSLLGLNTPMAGVLTVMAIAAGAMTVSHANDSYFWVVTKFGQIETTDGYKTQSAMTGIMGVVGIIFTWILSLFLI